MKPRGLAKMDFDLSFFDDGGIQTLYEEHSPDDADAAVVLFIRMMVRAHRLDRPDVRAEFARSKSDRRQAALNRLTDAGLIDELGLKPSSFEAWRYPDRTGFDSESQSARGLRRAATAERGADGRYLPSQGSTRLDHPAGETSTRLVQSLVQPYPPPPPLPTPQPETTIPVGDKPTGTLEPVDGDRDSLDTYHELTGYRPWGQWSGDALKGALTEYTDAKVDAALRVEFNADGSRATLLKRTLARLARDADRLADERKATAKPKPRARRPDLFVYEGRDGREITG